MTELGLTPQLPGPQVPEPPWGAGTSTHLLRPRDPSGPKQLSASRSPSLPPVLLWGQDPLAVACRGPEACGRVWGRVGAMQRSALAGDELISQNRLHGGRNEERNAENVTHQQNHPRTVQRRTSWGRAAPRHGTPRNMVSSIPGGPWYRPHGAAPLPTPARGTARSCTAPPWGRRDRASCGAAGTPTALPVTGWGSGAVAATGCE